MTLYGKKVHFAQALFSEKDKITPER